VGAFRRWLPLRQVPVRRGATGEPRIAEVPDEFEEAWVRHNVEHNWRTLDVVGEISEETGKSYAQIALNWLLRQEGVTAPVIGARHVEQLEDNFGAAGWELSPEQVARLSEVSAIEDVYPYHMIREMQRV
jgi:aryl-alcohol dehydrogenase-like predicted oxidoreductase